MKTSSNIRPYMPVIKKIPLFNYLDEKELQPLLKQMEIIKYEKSEKIITQGSASKYMFVVIKGRVEISVSELENKKIVIGIVREREIFGEAAIFMSETRTATVTSIEETLLVRIYQKNLISYIIKYPRAGNKLLMTIILGLLQKLQSTNLKLMLESASDLSLDYVDELVQDFMKLI